MCQLAHAAHEAGIHLSNEREKVSSIVVCEVGNEEQLLTAHDRIRDAGIKVVLFQEPDLGNECTALATEPIFGDARRLFSRFKLWKGDRYV